MNSVRHAAFDFFNVSPQRINWRMGGMIAAVGSVLITPWNLSNSPDTIHYTLDTLGAFIGPLYGVLIADYYLVKRRTVVVDDLDTLDPAGAYHCTRGYNLVAIGATAASALVALLMVFLGSADAAALGWFIGAGLAFGLYLAGMRASRPAVPTSRPDVVTLPS